MILGYLIIGVVAGSVMFVTSLLAGWGIGTAALAYCVVGSAVVLFLAGLAFAFPARRDQTVPQPRHSSV
ncbi:hypothetical protein [Thalassococcus profundi]|uniref:hypothetical protein n=1 Tax=Thalassococcus profundi TaxID=2282382 RepID=UPI004059B033